MTDGVTEIQSAPIMADAAPSVAVEAPVVTEAPVISEAATTTESPAVTEAPITETPPATESTILGDADEGKVAEAKTEAPVTETPPANPETSAEVVLPTYENFTLPENYNLDPEVKTEFTKVLGELETAAGKLDHAGYQAAGQKLIEMGVKNVQDSINRLNEYYSQFHENQKKTWLESFKADPEMGGDKLQKTISTIRSSIEQYGGTAEQVSEFRKLMNDTGVGNNPAVTRIIYNMQQKINKYETETGNKMLPAQKPAPMKVKHYQQFYGGN